MTRTAKDADGAKINRKLLVSFMKRLYTSEFSIFLSAGSLDLKDFWRWVHASSVALRRETVARLMEKSKRRTSEQA